MSFPRPPSRDDFDDDDSPRPRQSIFSGFGDSLRRAFSGGTSFFDWAIPFYTAFGIRVRIHLLFILFFITTIFPSFSRGDTLFTTFGLVGLFGIVLLHEYGHCFACRKVGGDADDILLWPLGGLASCRPPHNWRAELITVIWGPMVNVLLVPVFGLAVILAGGGLSALLVNPLQPFAALYSSPLITAWWRVAIWMLYFTNLTLLAFNVLLPMYPMDGGRIMQCLLWRSLGYRRATYLASTIGLFTAIALATFALISQQYVYLGIALFGGLTCYQERQRIAATDPDIEEDSPFAESLAWRESRPRARGGRDTDTTAAAVRREAVAREQAKRDSAELDRILAKIAKEGMASLSRREKAFLSTETQKKRIQ